MRRCIQLLFFVWFCSVPKTSAAAAAAAPKTSAKEAATTTAPATPATEAPAKMLKSYPCTKRVDFRAPRASHFGAIFDQKIIQNSIKILFKFCFHFTSILKPSGIILDPIYTRFLRAVGQGPKAEDRSTPGLWKCPALENPHVRLRAAAGGMALLPLLASTSSLMASTMNRATK